MNISVIGVGYVGLVSGACFSEFGFTVKCYDNDKEKINNLQKGQLHIYEPGLDEIISRNVLEKRLTFTHDLETAIRGSEIIIFAVGTPTHPKNNGEADLSFIKEAIESAAKIITNPVLFVIKSTVPIGTCRKLASYARTINPKSDFTMVSNPEFLREGSGVNDFFRPDRVIIGLENDKVKNITDRLYRPLYLFETPILYTDLETAETIKYAANGLLATKIAYINEIANLCEKTGADVQKVAKGVGLDNRIGTKFLHPSPGFGGSCFPKDIRALLAQARDHNINLSILSSVYNSNDRRVEEIFQKILHTYNHTLISVRVALLGLSFKPNTDDIRESSAIKLLSFLVEAGAKITAFDPKAIPNTRQFCLENQYEVHFSQNSYDAIKEANLLIIATEWNEFRSLDLNKVSSLMESSSHQGKTVYDLRNIYTLNEIQKLDLEYYSLGRQYAKAPAANKAKESM